MSFDTFAGVGVEGDSLHRLSYYRDLAAQCVLMAAETSTPEHKVALLDMARRWSELAEQVARAEIRADEQ